MAKFPLFVYGTLRSGHMRNSVLSNEEHLGKFKTIKKYKMISLRSFPGLLENGNRSIVGELYKVSLNTLFTCDRIEGHPHFYERRFIKLKTGIKAWAYFLPNDKYENFPEVKSGDWLKQ